MITTLLNFRELKFRSSDFVTGFTQNYQQGMLLQLSVLMSLGAFCWAVLVVWLGKFSLATIPVSYIFLTIVNIIACKTNNFRGFGCNFQIFISILLPFVFQLFMGGLASSGMVMIWSIVALGGVLTFSRGKVLYGWLACTIFLMVLSIATDEYASAHFDNPVDVHPKWFFAINGIMAGSTLFFIGMYFVRSQEKVKELLAHTNSELTSANRGLFEKNSEFINGLRYAETIQKAINPTDLKIKEVFPRSFCIEMPKDHVSGDFLWITESADWKLAACVDCTGHGMSGGLLAMMGSCIINGLVHEIKIKEPAELLRSMNRIVTERLNQKSNGNLDGMEVSVIAHNKLTNEVKVATAGGSVYCWRSETKELERIRLNSNHVGGALSSEDPQYETKTFKLSPGDRIYMSTDGFTDQFGGTENRKFSRKRFEELLSELYHQPIENQSKTLRDKLSHWQGRNAQTDDILVFGFEA